MLWSHSQLLLPKCIWNHPRYEPIYYCCRFYYLIFLFIYSYLFSHGSLLPNIIFLPIYVPSNTIPPNIVTFQNSLWLRGLFAIVQNYPYCMNPLSTGCASCNILSFCCLTHNHFKIKSSGFIQGTNTFILALVTFFWFYCLSIHI